MTGNSGLYKNTKGARVAEGEDVFDVKQFNIDVLRGFLKATLRDLQEICEFATTHDFVGDLFIVAVSNGAINRIEYVLKGGKENG